MRSASCICLVTSFLFLSCTGSNDNIQLKAVLESLQRSNEFTKDQNNLYYHSLNDRLKDPRTHQKAAIWHPKAMELQKMTNEMTAYIDSLKMNLKQRAGLTVKNGKEIYAENERDVVELIFEEQSEHNALSEKLATFRMEAVEMINRQYRQDSSYHSYYKKELDRLQEKIPIPAGSGTDTISTGAMNPLAAYFNNANVLEALSMLDKIKQDVLLTEHLMLNYLLEITTIIDCGTTETYAAMATQNSSYFTKGQVIEIYAGMGVFSTTMKPAITINGEKMAMDADPVATYKKRVPDKPGKYFIPVSIEFTKPDGTQAKLNKRIEYVVAE